MGQLVDEQQGGVAGEGAVEIELLDGRAPIVEPLAGELLQSLEQARRFGAPVGLDDPDDDVEAFRAQRRGPPRAW